LDNLFKIINCIFAAYNLKMKIYADISSINKKFRVDTVQLPAIPGRGNPQMDGEGEY
jgi:hypothetical protein